MTEVQVRQPAISRLQWGGHAPPRPPDWIFEAARETPPPGTGGARRGLDPPRLPDGQLEETFVNLESLLAAAGFAAG